MLQSLALKNFRGFKDKKFEFKKQIIILYGDNAKGKSTVLEAIFLILNGTPPWESTHLNLLNYESSVEKYFTISMKIKNENELNFYQDNKTKSYLIDKKKVSKKKFFNFNKANLFSPEQIELLMYLPQKRRDFLDHLISKIDLEYKENLTMYKKVLKQRNAHLKKMAKKFFETCQINEQDQQIKYWNEMLANLSTKLMVKRAEIIDNLKNKNFRVEYKPSLTLNLFEDMLDAEELKSIYKKQISENLKRDIVTGFSNIGAHRDDWMILSSKQDLKKFGSRGEKRLGIANLILQTQEIYKEYMEEYPILLLDDISAELDDFNIEKIFTSEILNKQQVFISTTKIKNLPQNIVEKAQVIKLS